MQSKKRIVKAIISREQSEGFGARVRRSIGSEKLRNLDPFLMLDEFAVPNTAGFPSHPHKGQVTVTYMLSQKFLHEDFTGKSGVISPGDLQFMRAGRGIVHSEMPHPDNESEAHGLQLWVNLASKDKLKEPAYTDLVAKDVPVVKPEPGIEIRVLAGDAFGEKVDVSDVVVTPFTYLDIRLDAGKKQVIPLEKKWNTFVYILKGSATFGDNKLYSPHHSLVFSLDGDNVQIEASDKVHMVLVSGKPINEPIQQYGHFVMNTMEEIKQAYSDFQKGINGFERGTWKSRNDKM